MIARSEKRKNKPERVYATLSFASTAGGLTWWTAAVRNRLLLLLPGGAFLFRQEGAASEECSRRFCSAPSKGQLNCSKGERDFLSERRLRPLKVVYESSKRLVGGEGRFVYFVMCVLDFTYG